MKNGWDMRRLGEIMLVERGGSPRPIQKYLTDDPDGLNWIKISDATASNKYIYKTKEKITRAGLNKTRQVFEGDFLLSNSMSFGRPYIMKTSGCIHDGWLVLRDKQDVELDQDFLYYTLSSPNIFEQFDTLAAGSTVRNLNIGLVSSIQIPIPPIEEQRRIVAVLDEAFAAIDKAKANTEKNIQNARELFDSYLNNIFSNPGPDWEETTLNEVYDVRDGTHHSPKYHSTGFPLITSKNLKQNGLSFEKVNLISKDDYDWINERSKVDHGDVLLAMIGTVGNPVLVNGHTDFAIKNVALFKVSKEQSGAFLTYYLKSRLAVEKMEKEASGTTQKFVSLKYLRAFPINLPAVQKQQEIVKDLDALSSHISDLENNYQRQLDKLNETQKALLHKAFSGNLEY